MTRALGLCIVIGFVGCIGSSNADRSPLAFLTPAELRYALRDTAFGFVRVPTDGTARGDTSRRILGAAMWELEGGDHAKGLRLLDAALRYGVLSPDPMTYHDLDAFLQLSRRAPAERLALLDAAARRWPHDTVLHERRISVLRRLGRSREADSLLARRDR